MGCVATDQNELVFCSAEQQRETTVSCAGWLSSGELVTGSRFSTQAKHLALSRSLGRIMVATLEAATVESGARER